MTPFALLERELKIMAARDPEMIPRDTMRRLDAGLHRYITGRRRRGIPADGLGGQSA